MTLTNPPDVVAALSAKLAACPSWLDSPTATGVTPWGIWYPSSAASTTPPLAVIEPGNTEYAQIAAGASAIRSGSARYIIILPSSSYNVGQAEKLARDLCDELTSNPLGLWISSASSEMSSEPDEGDQPNEFITVTIDVTHGLGG
jgi:hypothetical protein